MTTWDSEGCFDKAGVVEAYRLDRYDNFQGNVYSSRRGWLQKLIVWIGMTTPRQQLPQPACTVVEAYRLDRYDNLMARMTGSL